MLAETWARGSSEAFELDEPLGLGVVVVVAPAACGLTAAVDVVSGEAGDAFGVVAVRLLVVGGSASYGEFPNTMPWHNTGLTTSAVLFPSETTTSKRSYSRTFETRFGPDAPGIRMPLRYQIKVRGSPSRSRAFERNCHGWFNGALTGQERRTLGGVFFNCSGPRLEAVPGRRSIGMVARSLGVVDGLDGLPDPGVPVAGVGGPVGGGATPTTVVGAGSLAAVVGSSAVVVGCSASTWSVSLEVDDGSSLNPSVSKLGICVVAAGSTTTSTDPGVAFAPERIFFAFPTR